MYYKLNKFGTIDISDKSSKDDLKLTDKEYEQLMFEYGNQYIFKLIDGILKPIYKPDLQNELDNLYIWFEWYDKQVVEYNRCQRLGIEFDRNIQDLDVLALEKQLRIREILKEL